MLDLRMVGPWVDLEQVQGSLPPQSGKVQEGAWVGECMTNPLEDAAAGEPTERV